MRSKYELDHENKFYEQKKRDLEQIFHEFDRDGNGFLDKDEMANVVYQNNGVSEEDAFQIAAELVAHLDVNHDGRLSMEEFAE